MKLSEAIREGAKLRPQAIGDYFLARNDGEICSCALGAAYERVVNFPNFKVTDSGLDETDAKEITKILEQEFPFISENEFICCPDEYCDYSFLENTWNGLIAHFNDNHEMTREEIADWLEEKEK